MRKCYQVDVGYACAGVVVDGERVVEAAPIFKWMVGKSWKYVQNWIKNKDLGEVREVGE